VSTQYQGKTVYFSSKDASAKFKANPSKYAAALRPEGGVLARGASAKDDLVLTAVTPPEKAVHSRKDTESTAYRGRTYFVSSEDDMKEFKADPARYAAAINDKVKTKKADSPQWFTCGMDPDVLQKGPGKCPKCGMDLTSVKSTGAKSEHADHGMMQGQQGGGHGGMMQGQQGGGHGGQDQQNGGHPGCAPLGHEH
jgi:YHS domain-containing protein